MERIVAIKKLTKILGKSLGYRVDPRAPSADERQEAKNALPAAIEKRNKLEKEMNDRRHKILAEDVEYQRSLTAYKEARENTEQLASKTRHYKMTVGTSNGMFFVVKAEGDSWEEIIAKLTK